jgi:hypothetical protein
MLTLLEVKPEASEQDHSSVCLCVTVTLQNSSVTAQILMEGEVIPNWKQKY